MVQSAGITPTPQMPHSCARPCCSNRSMYSGLMGPVKVTGADMGDTDADAAAVICSGRRSAGLSVLRCSDRLR